MPEVASRAHLEAMVATVDRALATAGVKLAEVDGIAVTAGPGLAGALLVGQRTFGDVSNLHKLFRLIGAYETRAFDSRPVSCRVQPSVVSLPMEMRNVLR